MLSWKRFLTCFFITFIFVLSGCANQARIDAQNRAIQQEVQRQQHQAEAERQQIEAERREQERRNSFSNPTKPLADTSKAKLNDDFTNTEIDDGFKRWSSVWMWDQYIPNSARVIDGGFKEGAYIVRGDFGFVRGRSSHTIPFVAAFTESSQGYRLVNLCYNDNTSNMTDCIDPSSEEIAKVQSRQSLAKLLGVITVMYSLSNTTDDSDEDYDPNCNTGYVNLACGMPRWLR
ncbi:MAG: hypothetical protein WAT12_14255 [Candidatus Nitrotoga sp.]